jgi:hypothetical protein
MNTDISTTLLTPLISFHAIIDTDFGILKYAILNFGEGNVIDTDKLKQYTLPRLIGEIYRRKYDNPLYFIMKDEQYKGLLDNVYNEFRNEKEAEILQYSNSTDVIDLVESFKKSASITPTVLYYNKNELDYLNSFKELKGVKMTSLEEALNNTKQYSHYYFKYLSEVEPFESKVKETVLYVSTTGTNLDDKNSDIKVSNEKLIELANKRVRYAIYDIYRTDVIGDYK